MFVFGQSSVCVWAKLAKWLYFGKSVSYLGKVVEFGAKWLYLGKVVEFWQTLFYSFKIGCITG